MIQQRDLISKDYRQMQRAMHQSPRGYGGRGYVWANTVIEVARRYDVQSILDYGAGQGTLTKELRQHGFSCSDYDLGVPGMDGPPSFADLVVCTDVMEHIEPDRISTVLEHIHILARKAVFFVIATRPANKLLPNGQNAHLTIERGKWWRERVYAAGFKSEPPPTVMPEKIPGKCWMGVVIPC